jgi:hypothetical protein
MPAHGINISVLIQCTDRLLRCFDLACADIRFVKEDLPVQVGILYRILIDNPYISNTCGGKICGNR